MIARSSTVAQPQPQQMAFLLGLFEIDKSRAVMAEHMVVDELDLTWRKVEMHRCPRLVHDRLQGFQRPLTTLIQRLAGQLVAVHYLPFRQAPDQFGFTLFEQRM